MKVLSLISLFIAVLGFSELYQSFCKCQCESSYKVIPITEELVRDVSGKDCSICTKDFCLSNKYCELDPTVATCFQRGSFKDQFIVYGFLTVVIGLLGFKFVYPFIDTLIARK